MATLRPALISFDCAQTLVDAKWSLEGVARMALTEVGLPLPPEAPARLELLFREHIGEFLIANRTREASRCEQFWADITSLWLKEFETSDRWLRPIRDAADQIVYGANSRVFRLYEDVNACLDALSDQGYRLAVVSNWDIGLHRVLGDFNLHHRFEIVLASLEEGVEKPDPRLFQICLSRAGLDPERVLHIGDDLVDDIQGARNAGIPSLLLDRSGQSRGASTIGSLYELLEVLKCID